MMTSCCSTGIPGKKLSADYRPHCAEIKRFLHDVKNLQLLRIVRWFRGKYVRGGAIAVAGITDPLSERYWGKKSKNNRNLWLFLEQKTCRRRTGDPMGLAASLDGSEEKEY